MNRDDARMLALILVSSADAQALPEYPIAGLLESGRAGMAQIPYQLDRGRIAVDGHDFDVRELLACAARLREMARLPVQGRLL